MVYGGRGVFGKATGSWSGGRQALLLAILLVLGLLVCHGAVMGVHPPAAGLAGAGQGHPFAADDGPLGPPVGEHSVEYLAPGLSYALALLLALLASVWWPGRVRTSPGAAPWTACRRPPAAVFRRGRPPTISLLQVFRF